MKKQSVFTGIAGVAVILLLVSFLAMGRVLGMRPSSALEGKIVQPLATKFIPKQAPLVASFLVNPDRLELYTQLSTPPQQRQSLRQEWQQIANVLEQVWHINYDRFVRPWVGNEVTLAVTTTDLDRQPENGNQPGYLFALAIDDLPKAEHTLEKLWQQAASWGASLIFEQHQGVSVVTAQGAGTRSTLSGTILGNFALFANDPQVIRNAINDLQVSDLTLANFPRYRAGTDRLVQKRIGLAYINLAELGTWGTKAGFLSPSFADLPVASLILGFGMDGDTLQAEALLARDILPNTPITQKKEKIQENSLVDRLPGNATIFAGHDLETTWTQVQTALLPYPSLNALVTTSLIHLQDAIGFNLKQDIFTWVKGDYALALLPESSAWIFLAQKTDPALAHSAVERLDALAHEQHHFTVGKVALNKQEFTVWTQLKAQATTTVTGAVEAAHSETPEFVAISNSIPALAGVLQERHPASDLPQQDFAYFDRQVSLNWVTDRLGADQPLFPWVTPFLPHVQSATIARVPSQPGDGEAVLRGQISLTLQ